MQRTKQAQDLQVGDRIAGSIRDMEVLSVEVIERSSVPLLITTGLVYDGEVETRFPRQERVRPQETVVMADNQKEDA